MGLGYCPSFLFLLTETARVEENDCLDSFAQSDDSFDLICANFLNAPKTETFREKLLQGRFGNGFLCSLNLPSKVVESPRQSAPVAIKKEVSPVKVISRGELAGSKFVKSSIKSSFYCDARKLGIPAVVVDSVINNLSKKVDFRRILKKGDEFEVLYNSKNVMLYSKIITKRKQASVYRMTDKSGSSYYSDNGVKVTARSSSNVFAPPLKGKLCVSSAFGARVHPIRHVRHVHTGVDLKAQQGTPVYSIFDGVVTRASSYEGYGNCIDVCHSSTYSSRYAHLSRYAVRYGAKVKKGQLIGYTGSTGTSTGPHLHFELAKNDSVVNPLSVKMMPIELETFSDMRAFNAFKKQVEKIFPAK
jgi:murein DD-endopeptidase MepM/ murein hydrolase activator NlpD